MGPFLLTSSVSKRVDKPKYEAQSVKGVMEGDTNMEGDAKIK